jgi:hypothetical protein
LVADDTYLEKFQKADLSSIQPVVRSVIFVPPLYNWHLDFEDFRKALQYAWDHKQSCYADKWWKSTSSTSTNIQCRTEQDLVRHTRRQVKKAFKTYNEISKRNQTLIEERSSILVLMWTKILRKMRQCHKFRFASSNSAMWTPDFAPDFPTCQSYAQWHWQPVAETWPEGRLLHLPADLVCYIALDAMTRARSQIHDIELARASYEEPDWSFALRHPLLHLDGLRKVVLNVWPGHHMRHAGEEGEGQVVADVTYLLERCGRTIESLDCDGYGVHRWPEIAFQTPNLQTLELVSFDIPCSSLVALISSSKKLKKIGFASIELLRCKDPDCSWKDVFDALRNHDNALDVWMEVFVNGLDICFGFRRPSAADIQKKHASGQKYTFQDDFYEEYEYEDWEEALHQYVFKQGDWIKCLQRCFVPN